MLIYFIIYFLIFLLCSLNIFFEKKIVIKFFSFFCILLYLFIGFRFQVGGDWGSYLQTYHDFKFGNINYIYDILFKKEALFYSLYYFFSNFYYDFGFTTVNLICAIFFMYGLYRFLITLNNPFFSLLISFHFLIIVGMGYVRQSVTLGILFYILAIYNKISFLKLNSIVIMGSFFHFTSFLYLGFNFFKFKFFLRFINFKILIIVLPLFFLLFFLLIYYFFPKYAWFFTIWIRSYGAFYKIIPILFASLLYLFFNEKFKKEFPNTVFLIYQLCAIIGIILFPLSFFYPSLVDRLFINLIPLYIIVFSKLLIFSKSYFISSIYFIFFSLYNLLYLLIWFIYANNSFAWFPYYFYYYTECC